jgi:hypothetical protein
MRSNSSRDKKVMPRLSTALLFSLAACAVDDPDLAETDSELGTTLTPCTAGEFRCLVESAEPEGMRVAYASPRGFGADDLAAAYAIPATGPGTPTIAVVVAYGYPKLEADLAVYRAEFGLPPCTIANGCLRVVDQRGGAELPAESAPTNDWSVETMLDVDMASAACPRCNLLVVQSDDSGSGLLTGQATAVALGADVISNSWGRPEQSGTSLLQVESYFDHPGVAIFAAAGDLGYDNGGTGPSYPATSSHVIAVGGTRLETSKSAPRGFTESVWVKGGSGCSLSIAKPSYQVGSPCAFRASADVAAVADPATGVAIYHSRAGGGWRVVGGTSAAAPLVAGIFAAAGHGHRNAASLAVHPASFHDVTAGANGTCGTKLCEAAPGWDGPTGFGTPNGTVIASTVVPVEIPDEDPVTDEPPAEEPVAGCSAASGSGSFGLVLLIGLLVTRRRAARA